MIIAITAKDRTLQSEIDPRFGRAAWFMIANSLSGEVYAHENTEGVNAANGAGTSAAQLMAEYKVDIIYTGTVGPKAAEVLKKAGITYQENTTGTVEQVLDALSVDDEAQQSAGGQAETVAPPENGAIRLAVPADSGDGLEAQRSGHFGKCNYYVLVDIKDNQIQQVTLTEKRWPYPRRLFRPGDCCSRGITLPTWWLSGIGGRPLQGFRQSGIEVYSGQGQTVKETVTMFIDNQLSPLNANQVCGGGA